MTDELNRQLEELLAFRAERAREQFSTPKNLAILISIQAAKLLELFQWLEQGEKLSEQKRVEASGEVADLLICLLLMGEELGIDPVEAAQKMQKNPARHPPSEARVPVRYRDLRRPEHEWENGTT